MARKSDRAATALTARLKQRVARWGGDLCGVADIEPLRAIETIPADLLDPFTRAVSIAVRVPAGVFETVGDRPTPLYAAVYLTANRLLDDIAFRAAGSVKDEGFRSLPIPASQVLDRELWRGAISHKAVARLAGIGWQGKNLLLITQENAKLPDVGVPICGVCIKVCPFGRPRERRTVTQ